tara:strand:- start:855 stop:2384 length:1530 start_codon:yes stop_codon:yes gene_type:complete
MKATVICLSLIVCIVIGGLTFFAGLVFVGPNESLVIIGNYGDPKPAEKVLAEPGEIGIQKDVLGTGFHWVTPILYRYERQPIVNIPADHVGIITARHGKKIAGDRFLAEEGEIGIRRKVLGPGNYRINPYGYKVEKVRQVVVEPGMVGVLINSQQGGVMKDRALHPGVHYINPKQFKVVMVRVGLNEYTMTAGNSTVITDELLKGEVQPGLSDGRNPTGGAITFPSKDGFTVGIDLTVLWELTPRKAVAAVDTFGSVADLVERVIKPKFDSASRNEGSNYTAKEMIQGNSRAEFKKSFTKTLIDYTKDAPLSIVAALPRRVFVPVKIQLPIMQAQLKLEEMLTNKEIEETAKIEAKVEEQKSLVDLEIEQVKADTRVLRADIKADSEKNIGEFEAQTKLMVNKIELDIQKIRTQLTNIHSLAQAEVINFRGSKAAKLAESYIQAFGSAKAYNAYIFAVNALPKNKLPVKIIHAGEGTLWTDLKSGQSNGPLLQMKNFKQLNEVSRFKLD